MNRSRAYRRFQRKRAIHHKSMILRDYWKLNDADYWTPRAVRLFVQRQGALLLLDVPPQIV